MAKKTKAEQLRHQHDSVYTQWASKPLDQRTTNDTEQFTNELWAHGPRMGSTPEIHRQMMMNVIRGQVVNQRKFQIESAPKKGRFYKGSEQM